MTARNMSPQQKKRIGQFAEDAAAGLSLSKNGAQRVISAGSMLQANIRKLIAEYAAEHDQSPANIHASRYIPDRWEVVLGEDEPPTLTSIDELELSEFVAGRDDWLVGKTRRRPRGRKKTVMLGLSDAAWILEHQTEISAEVRQRLLGAVFAGTVLRDHMGGYEVPYFYRPGNSGLYLSFRWLDKGFYEDEHAQITSKKK